MKCDCSAARRTCVCTTKQSIAAGGDLGNILIALTRRARLVVTTQPIESDVALISSQCNSVVARDDPASRVEVRLARSSSR